jgi:2-oxo-hept-3-ene-1,7-dioate hydratase
MDEKLISELADKLHQAERSCTQIPQLSLAYPDITLADAYAIQQKWVSIKLDEGRELRGHKIGLTSKAMQRLSNIQEPDFGALLDDMFFEDGAAIKVSRFIVPRVEVELAFILRSPLMGSHCTMFDVLDATSYVVPVLEIVDARIQQVDPETKITRKVFDTVSDNAACAGVVVGGRPFRPMDLDIRRISAVMYRNGIVEDSGVAAAVLNHPANGPAWLTRKLFPYGLGLEAGQIVLGGSFTSAIAARAGDTFSVDYGEVGNISVSFI